MIWKTKFAFLIVLWMLVFGFTVAPLAAQNDDSPVTQKGIYQVGVQIMELIDESRDNRTLQTFIWYPALESETRPFPPDESGAPYPLIIYSHGYTSSPTEAADVFIEHLVSHGFVVAGVDHRDTGDAGRALVDRPLDVLFLIDQLASLEDNSLVGMMDTDNIGVAGYSFGGYTTLTVGGARIDPNYFIDQCAGSDAGSIFYCQLVPDWDDLNAYRDQFLPASGDDLWPAMTDERIRAVYPIAACFGQLFGESGLASVTVPAFIVAGVTDRTCRYDVDSAYMFQHLGSLDRYLLSMAGRDHGPIMNDDWNEPYTTAFFGYYLQGKTEYAQYLTPESADDLREATLDVFSSSE